jgi:hypothetical protein
MDMAARFVPASRSGRFVLLLIVVAWLVGGIAIGRQYAWSQSVGGMTAALSPVGFGLAAVGVLLFGLVAAVVGRVIRAPRGAARRATGAAVVALIAGIVGGNATAAATGGTYVEPIVHQSVGTINAAITSATATFRPNTDAPVTCFSVADGDAVGGVTALDTGELGGGTLRAFVSLESESGVILQLFIDAADVEDGVAPAWEGIGIVSARSPDGLTATVTFEDLRLGTDSKDPVPAPSLAGGLSGSLSWACEPFG